MEKINTEIKTEINTEIEGYKTRILFLKTVIQDLCFRIIKENDASNDIIYLNIYQEEFETLLEDIKFINYFVKLYNEDRSHDDNDDDDNKQAIEIRLKTDIQQF